MNKSQGWLAAMKDKSGRPLLPILEDMRGRDNAVLICSFGDDDPTAPLASHLAESHASQIASGLELLAEAAGCSDIILYAASLDLTNLAEKLGDKLKVTIKAGPSSPVLREQTALYSVLDTGEIRCGKAEAEYKKTFLSYGYQGRPTLVVDAETAFQAYRLSEWLGMTKHIVVIGKEISIRETETGTNLVTVLGDMPELNRVLIGGIWGRFFNIADLGSTVITYEYLFDSVKLFGKDDCVVSETAALYRYAAELGCQKCVLCREGSWQLQAMFNDITDGKADRGDMALIEDICPLISAGALCAFGRNMVSPALSAVSVCREEVQEHIVGKNCSAGICAGLLSYLIDPTLCTGCGDCMESCPEEAIEGEDGFIYMIDEKLCIKCGKCVSVCPEGAIRCGKKIKVPKKLTKVGKFH